MTHNQIKLLVMLFANYAGPSDLWKVFILLIWYSCHNNEVSQLKPNWF